MTRTSVKVCTVLFGAGLLLVGCGDDEADDEAATESTETSEAVTPASHCEAAEQFATDVAAAGPDASEEEVAAVTETYQDLQEDNRELGGQELSEADLEEVARCASVLTAANVDLP